MTWLITIALLCAAVLLLYLGWCWGVWAERREQGSREEAIRAQAYKDGRKSTLNEVYWGTEPTMTHEEYQRMYMGTWAPGIKNDTKESS